MQGPSLVVGKPVSHGPGLRTYIGQLQGNTNFRSFEGLTRGANRKTAVYDALMTTNDMSVEKAKPGLDALKQRGLLTSYEVLPLSNSVVLDVPENKAGEAWKALNQVPGMGRILRNREVTLQAPTEGAVEGARRVSPNGAKLEWNVEKVGAPQVWAQGFEGQGVTIGSVDTGVDVNHPALNGKYRGRNADGTLSNAYNFYDAYANKSGINPFDDNAHGTHTVGTMMGSTPDYVTGVAPKAKWIATKILSGSGSGSLESVTRGLEWMLAPRDAAGQNPDPKKAPDIISNSWGTNNGKLTAFQNLWKAFIAAGVEPVAAAGNSGPRASTVGAPGSYPESISVGATDSADKVANFSSRGPSPLPDASGNAMKPDVSAPGANVMSTVPGGGYKSFSGTSMATPAVSGVVALLLSKHPDLTHAEVVSALKGSSVDIDAKGPDMNSGFGRVDANAALALADKLVAARKPA